MGPTGQTMPRKKKPGSNYQKSTCEDVYYKADPPLLVRDPIPRQGLMEFLDSREMKAMGSDCRKSYIDMYIANEEDPSSIDRYGWIVLIVVLAQGKISLYRPECMFTGFNAADCLASIPVENIALSAIDPKLGILDLCSPTINYRFRSQQQGDVARWQHAIMNGATPGMERLWDDDFEESDNTIWSQLQQRNRAHGGLESALAKPADRLEKSEEDAMLELFCSIGDCPKDLSDKDHLDAADLISWSAQRMNLVKDQKLKAKLSDQVTPAYCIQAHEQGMTHDNESVGRMTFPVFKRAMCNYDSELREIVLAMLKTFPDMERWQYVEAVTGELTTSEFIYMYHLHMGDVVKACRHQLHESSEGSDVITNNAAVMRVWLEGV